ncbi:MAG: hypothetical protein EP330_10035 [Deltaproteobacteria bacterium]|nr:MAG: hypothetical protein EP330_10035 [Deltaproteobacteria bacterium]
MTAYRPSASPSRHPATSATWTLRLLVVGALALVGCKDQGDDSPVDTATGEDLPVLRYSMEPAIGAVGTTVAVRVYGTASSFAFGDTDLVFGEELVVDSVTVFDGYTVEAVVTIPEAATLGEHPVTLTIEGSSQTLSEPFVVVDQSIQVAPDNAKMGEMIEVEVTGLGTEWSQGYTWASFGEGIDVLDVDIVDPNLANVTLAIHPDAPPGVRDVSMEDGPSVVTLYDGFTVDRAVITAVWEPPQAYQGDTIAFTITGLDTSFGTDATIRFFDDGGANPDITVSTLTVIDEENMYGRIRLSNAAALGFRDVVIESNGEAILLPDALEVLERAPSLTDLVPRTFFDVSRQIDNDTGEIFELVQALAYFIIPLDPPCGNAAPPGSGPMPYDVNGVFPVPPEAEPADCPNPRTVSAGDVVWFESDRNVVTLYKEEMEGTNQILYVGRDLTLTDYVFDNVYDLHTQGDPEGLPEVIIDDVQPTVPADYTLTSPPFYNDLTVPRTERFEYQWTPAETYPDAIFGTNISGILVSDGEPGFAASLPWDDGSHAYTPLELGSLEPGPVSFAAFSYIEGRLWGWPGSTVQTVQSTSVLSTSAQMILEDP